MEYRLITPEDADLLISIGVKLQYSVTEDEHGWFDYTYQKWAPSDYFNTPPVGGVFFRIAVE